MSLQLTRTIPARNETVKFRWISLNFIRMSPRYREVRAKMKTKMDRCFGCRHPFADGEMMALAAPLLRGGNKVLCRDCALKAGAQEASASIEEPNP